MEREEHGVEVGRSEPDTSAVERAEEGSHGHPPYMMIWGVLAILMFAKVGVSVMDIPKSMAVSILVVISLVSAGLVALYYMHLRFEPNRLRLVALAPLPLVAIMILTILMEYR